MSKAAGPLIHSKFGEIIVLAENMNARLGQMSMRDAHIRGSFGVDSYRSKNAELFLSLCSGWQLFLAGTSFRRSSRRRTPPGVPRFGQATNPNRSHCH